MASMLLCRSGRACCGGVPRWQLTRLPHRVLSPQPNLQAGIKPPTFVLFCNDTKLFPDDYRKYIERQFRCVWVDALLCLR